jgi:hypothetical protein
MPQIRKWEDIREEYRRIFGEEQSKSYSVCLHGIRFHANTHAREGIKRGGMAKVITSNVE